MHLRSFPTRRSFPTPEGRKSLERKKLAARARLLLGCVAAGGLLLAVACRRETQYFGKIDPPHENVFRFNNAAEPEYVDPGLLSGQPDDRIARLLFEGAFVHRPGDHAADARGGGAMGHFS